MTHDPTPNTAPIPAAVLAAWSADLRPRCPVETWIVARAARSAARVDRLADAANALEARDPDDPSLPRLRREEAAAERRVHQALALLSRGRSKSQPLWSVDPDNSPAAIEPAKPAGGYIPAASPPNRPTPAPPPREPGTTSPHVPRIPSPRPSGFPLYQRIGNPEGDLPISLSTSHPLC